MDEIFGVIFLIVCVIALVYAIQFWYITIPVVVIIIALYYANEARKKRNEEEALWRAEQQRYLNEMISLCKQSLDLFVSMPLYLSSAERDLDRAERNFTDGAFAPFWDSIETSAKSLGHFNEGICNIKRNSSRYTELIRLFAGNPPSFPISLQSITKLNVGTGTARRMEAIVRDAQRNFQFAMIYEQRKTNQILVAGFTNLAQALGEMTSQIESSVRLLSYSFDRMTSTIDESARAIHSRQGEILEATTQSREESSTQASAQANREEKALAMLDNIQRGRRPSF